MPVLDNASRRVPKATYVPLTVPLKPVTDGQAVPKFGYVAQLALQPGEVAAVQDAIKGYAPAGSPPPVLANSAMWQALHAFEGSPLPSQLPSAAVFAPVPVAHLQAFGTALAEVRQAAVTALQPPATSAGGQAGEPVRAAAELPAASPVVPAAAQAVQLLNTVTVVNKGFAASVAATPVGMLNLERLEMTPAGISRGDLVATIPLAPGEKTSVVQKEWSVTSQEFTSIVTDSLTDYSETGVTEKTDLSQSTDSQVTHSNQFNINASVSGSTGFVTASVATGYSAQDQNSQSAKDSRDHAIATTRKASARVTQEHKMTISTTTVSGQGETTTRELSNPSDKNPMRIDYFSMMEKWRVRLYRYGLRLTYDIAIPEPGAAMREPFAQLATLQKQATKVFAFPYSYADINQGNYQQLASQYGAQVVPPPGPPPVLTVPGPTDGLTEDDDNWHFFTASFVVPDGFQIDHIDMTAKVNVNHKGLSDDYGRHVFDVLGTDFYDHSGNEDTQQVTLTTSGNAFMAGFTGSQAIACHMQDVGLGSVTFTVYTVPTAAAVEQWVATVWGALYNAAQTSYYAGQNAINAQISALQDQISGVDTLTLRREENDEIMKGVLRWLLGPSFDFMPPEVVALFGGQGSDLAHGVAFTGNETGLSATGWATMVQYQEMVKFINEAIEWENVLYFLYSYFWDVPESWDFIRGIRHQDATRQAFLRSGAARVVLTIRPGYEKAWTSFVELGDFGLILPPDHPYMKIAQEIQDYANTNYPGIPPANPSNPGTTDDSGEKGVLLGEWYEYTPTSGTDIAVTSNLATIA